MQRDYQAIAEANILQAFESHNHVMFAMATRLGKTVIATDIIKGFLLKSKRVLFIAHREELITQSWNTFHKNKIFSGIIKAGMEPNYSLPCQVASIQTLIRRKLPPADLIICDECHHVLEDNSYGKIIEQYPYAKVLGITATPYRLGGRGFTKIFDVLVESLQMLEGIDQGWLTPFKYFAASMPDMSKVHLSAGDYKEDESVKAMELAPIVESYMDHCQGMSGLCYAVNRNHSAKIQEQYIKAGLRAEIVDANTPADQRRSIFNALKEKKIQVLINVGIATEGTDIPNCDFIQLARPTKSLSLMMQMASRANTVDNEIIKDAMDAEHRKFLISCSSKPHCIILDNAGLCKDHPEFFSVINWQRYFQGYKKPKKKIEEMMEMIEFVAEDESGRQVRTKVPKEIEGLKLIEINRVQREKIVNLQTVKEFDRLYAMFKRLPQINKPGFKAYYEYRNYCERNSFALNDEVWDYLIARLSTDYHEMEERLRADAEKKVNRIIEVYDKNENEKLFLTSQVNGRFRSQMDELGRFRVPSSFLKKEKEKYLQLQIIER